MLKNWMEAILGKVGVVFSNLGTPRSPTPKDLGRYLNEFLMDPYVIQVPYLLRVLLIKGIIVPFRKAKSAANYQKIWAKEGSPLLIETKKAARALQEKLGHDYQVEVGMRYGEPSFKECREKLKDCESVILFQQYPQYAESSVQTGLDHFFKYFEKSKVTVIPPYYDDPHFLKAYGDYLTQRLSGKSFDHLLMSFHGLPESHITKLDPSGSHCLKADNCCDNPSPDILKVCYRAQCYHSARGIAAAAQLPEDKYSVCFQSRLGRQKWIDPYIFQEFQNLLDQGKKDIIVICPGFPVDGLETLEEIAMGGRETFIEMGGNSLEMIPCLNDDPVWIQACAEMIRAR